MHNRGCVTFHTSVGGRCVGFSKKPGTPSSGDFLMDSSYSSFRNTIPLAGTTSASHSEMSARVASSLHWMSREEVEHEGSIYWTIPGYSLGVISIAIIRPSDRPHATRQATSTTSG